jgi:hypothetical protein
MRVVILAFSSRSYETIRLVNRLRRHGFDVVVCHPARFAVVLGEVPLLTYEGQPFERPAVVLVRTGSATGLHAANLLRQMELMGIVVINPLEAIQRCMDKDLHLANRCRGRPTHSEDRHLLHCGRLEGLGHMAGDLQARHWKPRPRCPSCPEQKPARLLHRHCESDGPEADVLGARICGRSRCTRPARRHRRRPCHCSNAAERQGRGVSYEHILWRWGWLEI